jgi:probable phosphoglycerate mutase
LHEDGWGQSRAVAALLAHENITRIVASPLTRARQTAEPLAERIGLPIETVEGWAEADRHLSRYRSTETLRALGPAEWRRFLADPILYLGGDPVRFRADVVGALGAVVRASGRGAHVAVFTHGLPINIVLSQVLGLEGIVHFAPNYGSVTRLHARSDGTSSVVCINECGHHIWRDTSRP